MMQGDDPPFGPTAHGTRMMKGGGRSRTAWQDESAQRCKLAFESIDLCFEQGDVGVRRLGDATRLAPRGIGGREVGAELEQGGLEGQGEDANVVLLGLSGARAEESV